MRDGHLPYHTHTQEKKPKRGRERRKKRKCTKNKFVFMQLNNLYAEKKSFLLSTNIMVGNTRASPPLSFSLSLVCIHFFCQAYLPTQGNIT